MKKKFLIFTMLALCMLAFSACGKNSINLNNFLIEKRECLFTACDDLYSATFSTGLRETNYNLDGVVNELVPFGILTIVRNDNKPLANDKYTYLITINEQSYSGFLEKDNSNSYSADLEINTTGDETIYVEISFTGYTFKGTFENTSKNFQVDCPTALEIAQKELKEGINNLLEDKNIKIEVIMKIMKDHSNTELKSYYWYVGIISTNGDTLGILVDANTGDIIAKKV